MKIRPVSISMALPCVVVASLALLGCPEQGGKSPFATENVSVAPQVDGRAPAPTPIPPPPAEAAAPESE